MSRLGELTSPAVAGDTGRTLLVPVGSCEQHGPHLPLDTDTRLAVAVADGAAAHRTGLLVAPPIAIGASGEHQGFAGTLSIGREALRSVLVELGRSAFLDPASPPYRELVFVNGHGGNVGTVEAAASQLRDEGRPVRAWSIHYEGADAHAGRTETSLMLAVSPGLVGPERPVGNRAPVEELLSAMRAGGVAAVSPSGVLGDARGASADEGRTLLDGLVEELLTFLTEQSTVG